MDDVEVYEVRDGQSRPGFGAKPPCLAVLSSAAPLPCVGDILILRREDTNDAAEQAYYHGAAAPFRVVEVERHYMRSAPEDDDAEAVPLDKAWVHVRRISREEYALTPGQTRKA